MLLVVFFQQHFPPHPPPPPHTHIHICTGPHKQVHTGVTQGYDTTNHPKLWPHGQLVFLVPSTIPAWLKENREALVRLRWGISDCSETSPLTFAWVALPWAFKKKGCICNYFPLLPHHCLGDLALAPLLLFSLGFVDQQHRFDIHVAAMIEMQRGVLLTQRSFSFSLPGHFPLLHLFLLPFFSFCCAHTPHFPRYFTYLSPV